MKLERRNIAEKYPSDRFLVSHFSGSGFNNQIQQILNSIAIASILNRTYCLSPFLRRKSDEIGSKTKFTEFTEIFDTSAFERIVELESIASCSLKCDKKISYIINLSSSKISEQAYERQNIMKSIGFESNLSKLFKDGKVRDLDKSWLSWNERTQVESSLESNHMGACIEVYQPFPASNIIINGEMKFLSSGLQLSSRVENLAELIASELFFEKNYLSVHWRYEYQVKGESKCRKKNLPSRGSGEICFVIFLKKKQHTFEDNLNFGDCTNCDKYLQYVHLKDVGDALRTYKAASKGLDIYLASDANTPVLKNLRKMVNFKGISDSKLGREVLENESMEVVSAIEQAICAKGTKFIGTSYSTWTTTVWMLRHKKRENAEQISGFLDLISSGGSKILQ